MKESTVIGDVFKIGKSTWKLNYKLWLAKVPSKNFLICLHGSGEVGPADGSRISLVQKYGIPNLAANGFEFDYNIIAFQVETNYTQLVKCAPQFVMAKFGAEKIGCTGLSLGGIATDALLLKPGASLLNFVAPVCGKVSPPWYMSISAYAATFPEIPIQAWHGDKDKTVSFTTDKKFIEAYNASHIHQVDFRVLPGMGHNIWDVAYATNSDLLKWINLQFSL
ncbi:MAG TPA: hypothetical protein VL443_24440 [Cyclobacteriaceae bacterium]|jgi:predicted esterase|nr:hypothetical protein [Cyclobacteriaceae bacterium]